MRDNAEAAETIFGQVVDAARALGVTEIEAIVAGSDEALTRFANNAIHQNVAERTTHLSVRPVIDGRTARASTNRLSRDAIREVVAEAIAIAKLTEPDPDLPPLAGPAEYQGVERWFEATARATPEERARAVAEAIRAVEAAGQTAAGIYSTGESAFALLNSRGVLARHTETMARFSITAMAADSSGWAKASACDLAALNPLELALTAARKAARIDGPARVAAGPLYGDSGAGRGARPDRPDVPRLQRHGHPRRPQFSERPHRQADLRREHHHS